MRTPIISIFCALGCGCFGIGLAGAAEPFWHLDGDRRIRHGCDSESPVVLCMQGRQVVLQTEVDSLGSGSGLAMLARFFEVPRGRTDRQRLMFQSSAGHLPHIQFDQFPWKPGRPQSVVFDGMLTVHFAENYGITASCTVFPSVDKPLILQMWTLRVDGKRTREIEVMAKREVVDFGDGVSVVWESAAVPACKLREGKSMSFASHVRAVAAQEATSPIDIQAEYAARRKLADAAWTGPCRLETPDAHLNMAFALQNLHALECPIDTIRGTITHNGSLRYSPGIWANDPVEYSSPLFPFLGDATLQQASIRMYRVWLDFCRQHGIDPFPGSFEHADLRLAQIDRGDDAMMLYGLSKFLLFLGDRDTAKEFWPLVEMSARSVQSHTRPDGVVASKSDEMEGRYPTGEANLSTSSLAYGGYRLAARLAASLGHADVSADFDRRADALRLAIEAFFGASVEGYDTYRYYEGNRTLRGWILLPLAMGIHDRREGTLDALLSDSLWPRRAQGGDLLAESGRDTEWGRETYYALRVLFQSGRTELALQTTRQVVQKQIFGPAGPYPDEDAIDMLCPGSLYPRAIIEGLFGISPLSLDSFSCQPFLPQDWPRMALRDLRAFGQSWDLVVERDGAMLKTSILIDGELHSQHTAPPGATIEVKLSSVRTR